MNHEVVKRILGSPEDARERGWQVERKIYEEQIMHLRVRIEELTAERDRSRLVACRAFEVAAAARRLEDGAS